jgi:hypothetical protein
MYPTLPNGIPRPVIFAGDVIVGDIVASAAPVPLAAVSVGLAPKSSFHRAVGSHLMLAGWVTMDDPLPLAFPALQRSVGDRQRLVERNGAARIRSASVRLDGSSTSACLSPLSPTVDGRCGDCSASQHPRLTLQRATTGSARRCRMTFRATSRLTWHRARDTPRPSHQRRWRRGSHMARGDYGTEGMHFRKSRGF